MTPDQPQQDADDPFADAFAEAFPGVGQGEDTVPLSAPAPDPGAEAQLQALTDRIARELAAAGPGGWQRLDAVFALTLRSETVRVTCTDGTRAVDMPPGSEVLRLVREQRRLAARMPGGPWWRLLMKLGADGALEVEYDYGDLPFPDEYRLPPDAYRADLAGVGFPGEKLPTWLAAYIGHGNRQLRSPRTAAARARADAEAAVRPVASVGDLPALPATWARWALLSAGFAAIRSGWGPRVRPSHGLFEGATRSGSSLWLLPGDRAVLSGGVWDAPELAAAYRGDAPFPELFAGAPDWVTDAVLDARGSSGLMSFCYWWDGGRWCRGESPGAAEFAKAVPGVWTRDTVGGIIASLTGREEDPAVRRATEVLVAAADIRAVRREMLVQVFGSGEDVDLDGAFQQLLLAGVVKRSDLPPIPEHVAIGIVRKHLLDNGPESPGYQVRDLTASRLSVGWMVYVPVPQGEIRISRAIFYVADDAVLEQSSSATAPSRYEAGFEQRFRERRNA